MIFSADDYNIFTYKVIISVMHVDAFSLGITRYDIGNTDTHIIIEWLKKQPLPYCLVKLDSIEHHNLTKE